MEKVISGILKKAEENHVDASISIGKEKVLSFEYNRDKLKGSTEGNTSLLEIRLSKGKKYGFSTTTLVNNWERCFDRALKIMRVSKPIKHDIILAEPKKLKPAEGIYSKTVAEMPVEKLFDKAEDAVAEAKSVKKEILVISGKFSREEEETLFANSNGVTAADKSTTLSGSIECGLGTAVGLDGKSSHSDINFIKTGKSAGQMCIDCLNPKPIKTMRTGLILDYFAASDLINAALVPAVLSENVQNKRSYLSGKLGRKVFADSITIYDDGLLAKGLNSGRIDGEGSPSQRTEIISKGVLKNYLYDLYSAKIDKKKTTGNSSSIAKVPSVGVSNFVMKPGRYSREEIIRETKNGILAEFLMGTHFVNSVTGDASVGVSNAFYVEDGEIKHPIKQAMISLNIFDALKKIEIIGNNMRQESDVVCPTIKLEGVQIVA
ncbi:MAG: TldD/PmbA family protein [Candidatus Nanoarchaeia archaeon]|nr:TldD/PmbA family protein [Candidatus Nanoarchaeia archaeon]MDD5239365.1 TldD/PmbA family protein [Candidatus Nanoarchaeia archaeon]